MADYEDLTQALEWAAGERAAAVGADRLNGTIESRALLYRIPENYKLQAFETERLRDYPFRKRGKFLFDQARSFALYVKAHAEHDAPDAPQPTDAPDAPQPAIFQTGESFQCYLNGHTPESPGWGDHEATFTLKKTPEWLAWLGQNSHWMPQQEFAEFLEDRIGEIAQPDGATLFECAKTLKVRNNVNFSNEVQLANGQVRLVYQEDLDGTGGARGDLRIPEAFTIALQPYDGTALESIAARLRWRFDKGKVFFRFGLGEEPERIRKSAVEQAVLLIQHETGGVVLYGGKV